jgi:hypothetical protein
MDSTLELRIKVNTGAAWLTEVLGKDWPEFIDLDELTMSNPQRCILGQSFEEELGESEVYNGFNAVLVGISDNRYLWSVNNGFDTYTNTYRELENAWVQWINEWREYQEVVEEGSYSL